VLLQHEPGDPGECEASEQQETLSSVRLTNLHLQLLAANKNFIFILWPSRKQKEKLKPKRRTEKRKSNNSDTYVHATLKEWSAYKTKERNMTPYGIFMRELLRTQIHTHTHIPLEPPHRYTHGHTVTHSQGKIFETLHMHEG